MSLPYVPTKQTNFTSKMSLNMSEHTSDQGDINLNCRMNSQELSMSSANSICISEDDGSMKSFGSSKKKRSNFKSKLN